ncbi:MAG: hypothetical protein ACI8QS_003487, partial [Planctomycetota bacterium]
GLDHQKDLLCGFDDPFPAIDAGGWQQVHTSRQTSADDGLREFLGALGGMRHQDDTCQGGVAGGLMSGARPVAVIGIQVW